MTEKVTPIVNCAFCHGTGEVVDWVPYGSTNVPMPSTCECVFEQLDDPEAEFVIEQLPIRGNGKPHEHYD